MNAERLPRFNQKDEFGPDHLQAVYDLMHWLSSSYPIPLNPQFRDHCVRSSENAGKIAELTGLNPFYIQAVSLYRQLSTMLPLECPPVRLSPAEEDLFACAHHLTHYQLDPRYGLPHGGSALRVSANTGHSMVELNLFLVNQGV